MAAVAVYKVRKPFMYEGQMRKIGAELILDSREADEFVRKGLVLEGRFLDPEDANDKKTIEDVKTKMAGKKTERAAEVEARSEARDERLAEEDEQRKALIDEAVSLLPDDADAENLKKDFEKMNIAQLEATVKDLKEKEKPAEEETPSKPEAPKAPAAPKAGK